jgi:hypothetical protein
MGLVCPFLGRECVTKDCRLYNTNRDTCRFEDIELHLFEIKKWLNH